MTVAVDSQAVVLPDVYSVCEHEHRRPVEERWDIAERERRAIAVCVCCWGPCFAEMVPAAEFIPGAPGEIGVNVRCKVCPE